MADINNPNQDDEEDDGSGAAPGGAPPGGAPPPPAGGGQSPNVPSGGSAPAAAAPGGSKMGSGRFQNIQKYIQANQGVDYAGRIGGELKGQADQFKAKLGAVQGGIDAQVNPELQRLQGAGNTIQSTLADPTASAANQDQLGAFNKLRTGDYLKDVQIADKGNLMQQQQALGQSADMSKTEPGRFQLLRNTFSGSPNYTQGANKLDQLLLQSKSGQIKSLSQQAQGAAQQSQQDLSGLEGTVAGYNQQLGQLGTAAQQQAQSGIEGLVGSSKADLEARRAQEQSSREGQYAQSQSALQNLASSGKISADMAQKLGLSAGQNLYGLDAATLSQAAQKGATDVGLQNITTAEDVAKFQALGALSGNSELGGYSSVGPQLGNAVNYNQSALQDLISSRKNAYDADMASTTSFGAQGGKITGNEIQGGLGGRFHSDADVLYDTFLKGGKGGAFLNNQNIQAEGDRLRAAALASGGTGKAINKLDYDRGFSEEIVNSLNSKLGGYGQGSYEVQPYEVGGRTAYRVVQKSGPNKVQYE